MAVKSPLWQREEVTQDSLQRQLGEHSDTNSTQSKNPVILSKPIAIPATNSEPGSPFLRAYPVELESFGISREPFLEFIDHLNRVIVLNPMVVGVGMVGDVVSMIPEPTAALTGTIVGAVSTGVALGSSYLQMELLLRHMNRETFNPIGLKVKVIKTNQVAELVGMPILNEEGKIRKDVTILDPNEASVDLDSQPAQLRRVRALAPWTSPLEIDAQIRAPKNPATDRWTKVHVAASEWQRKDEQKSFRKARQKSVAKFDERKRKAAGRHDKEIESLARKEKDLAKRKDVDDARVQDKLVTIQERRDKLDQAYTEKLSQVELEFALKNKEEKVMRNLYWLVIARI
ncbi:hypothetical protein B0A52_07291 [Exophiala mesophila]|uniref:Uncharacterized protein n=1 Tax=Exophiala mesophila TaxID=212818 RepID=A0A438MX06_EXOME|nr:hypothetical protein B0A52_07291 [Exophiala mesophila]